MNALAPLTLAALAWTLAAPAAAQAPASRIEFAAPSYATPNDFRNGVASAQGRAAVTLWLPPGAGPFPAVMIGHSVAGWKDQGEGQYVGPLLAEGYAVLGLDHFGPRGIERAADVAGVFNPVTAISDALLALKIAAANPKIDAKRVGIMGLSMGGIATEGTAFEYVRQRVLGEADIRFAAHVSFYGPCQTVYMNGAATLTGAPVLLLKGDKDETTARAKCEAMTAAIKAAQANAPIETIWYPGAYHAWDVTAFPAARYFPNHVNLKNCPVLDFGAQVRFIDIGGAARPFVREEFQSCFKASAGYSMGHDAAVAAQARAAMLAFFAKHLKGG